jgi:hypothetical protein
MQEKFFKVKKVLPKSLFAVAFLCFGVTGFSQDEQQEKEKGFHKENLFVGGNFGLTFGNYTLINVSPQIGYRFNKLFAAGFGINLQYVGWKTEYSDGDYEKVSQIVTGLNVFGRVYPIRNFMIQVQPEANYIFGKQKYYDASSQTLYKSNRDAVIAPSLLAGGGLVLPAGRGAFITSVFYDVLQNDNSPYGNRPIVNFTYNVGL